MMRSILLTIPLTLAMSVGAFAQGSSWLGVSIDDGSASGVRVVEVEASSPAAKAGLEADDLILEYDGIQIVGVRQLTRIVRETPVGRTVTLNIRRGGEERTLRLVTEARPGFGDFRDAIPETFEELSDLADSARRSLPGIHVSMSVRRMGIRVDGMTPQLREFFGVDPDVGILVVSVEPDSPAQTAGLRVGDVITNLDGRDVASPSDFGLRAFRSRGSVTLIVVRDRSETEVALDLTVSDN